MISAAFNGPKNIVDLYDYALTFWGAPYVYGGNFSPIEKGGDCSGLIMKLLQYGKCAPSIDCTADTLYHFLLDKGQNGIRRTGSIAFFGREEHITHCGWMIDQRCMLNASGGGKTVTTPFIAKSVGAKVTIDPISRRADLVAVIFPNYAFTG